MLFNLSRHFTCLNNELQVWTRWRHVDQRQTCPVSHRSGLCYRCFQNQLKSCLLVLSELWREGLTMVMTLMTLKTWITYPKLQQNIFKIHAFFMLKWYAWLFLCIAVFQKPCRKYPHVPYQTNGWSVSYEEAIWSLMLPSFHKWIVP